MTFLKLDNWRLKASYRDFCLVLGQNLELLYVIYDPLLGLVGQIFRLDPDTESMDWILEIQPFIL